MGFAVGFISGMFGIGGGFLMTPLLIFLGISPAVSVATRVEPHRRVVDVRRDQLLAAQIARSGARLACCWRAASSAPPSASGCSRCCASLGQLDITIGLSYVLLLGIVGALMVTESVRAIMRVRQGKPVELRRPGSHTWIHGLPFKLRFKRSHIYVSAIPVWAIGFVIGFIGAVMGIGGGFLLVPLLIYVLRVPTATVIGTSMVLTLVTMASATVMHAATNHLVDAVLALVLMVGGVTGAQFGARAGQKISGERLRLLLGAPGARGRHPLRVRARGAARASLFDPAAGGRPMRTTAPSWIVAASPCSPASSARRRRRRPSGSSSSLSNHRVMVTSNFTGDEVVLFGGIEQDANSTPAARRLRHRRHGDRPAGRRW